MKRGFTLIELLIVVAIIGILAALIVPNIMKFTSSADVAAANTELAMVRTGVTAFMADNSGQIPTDVSGISPYFNGAPLKGTYHRLVERRNLRRNLSWAIMGRNQKALDTLRG